MKTKLNSSRMAQVRTRCGFSNGIDVDAHGSRGGLSIGWKDDVLIQLQSYSTNHMDVVVCESDGMLTWRLIGFYGALEKSNKDASWELLRNLKGIQSLPWLVVGDFNDIMFSFEKQGGRLRNERNMAKFRVY